MAPKANNILDLVYKTFYVLRVTLIMMSTVKLSVIKPLSVFAVIECH